MLTAVWHVGFTVANLDRSIYFYCNILGFELVRVQEKASPYTGQLVGFPGAHLRSAALRLPGQAAGPSKHVLELIEYVTPQGATLDCRPWNVGSGHLALCTDDIHERYAFLLSMGVNFRSAPTSISEGANAGGFACYLQDPDGITLELVQPPPYREESGAV